MRPNSNRSNHIVAAAAVLFLSNLSDGNAEQQSDVPTEASPIECSEMAFEVAYQTPPRFISWLLERPDLIAQIAATEARDAAIMLNAITVMNGKVDRRQNVESPGLAGGGGE